MTFWRWLFFLIKVAVVAVAAVWVAQRPGHVSFVWLGYRLDTSIGVLLAALLLLLLLFILLQGLWRLVWRGPRDLGRLRSERKRRQGYRALSQGMEARRGRPEMLQRAVGQPHVEGYGGIGEMGGETAQQAAGRRSGALPLSCRRSCQLQIIHHDPGAWQSATKCVF